MMRETMELSIAIPGITVEHVAGTLKLPMIHRDPFYRLMISQSLNDGLSVQE
jgi:PIN domain nuclease of toxin-antitoxin system